MDNDSEKGRGSVEEKWIKQVIALVDQWLDDDSGYDEATWPELKESLDRDRPSNRRLFDAEPLGIGEKEKYEGSSDGKKGKEGELRAV